MDKNIILFDDFRWEQLLPLTFTRPVSHIRIGILTIIEKWEKHFEQDCYNLTQEYLAPKFPLPPTNGNLNLLINGGVLPNKQLVVAIRNLQEGEALVQGKTVIAALLSHSETSMEHLDSQDFKKTIQYDEEISEILNPWDIFSKNGDAIQADWGLVTKGRESQRLSDTNHAFDSGYIFIEKGARVECSTLNAMDGPIYIGKNAEVMEGSLIRGPFALCDHSELKMGAKIYGPTTIGPHCKVGGEVNNSIFFGFSNKAHDGFLGNSVIGEWCNIGADTNTSNLKNNYAPVKLWSYKQERFANTGLLFCGLIFGDHSKCGINTMFNTGTVVGICSNIFGDGFPRNFIPSFSWGGAHGLSVHPLNKVFETTEIVMGRRGLELSQTDRDIISYLFTETTKK